MLLKTVIYTTFIVLWNIVQSSESDYQVDTSFPDDTSSLQLGDGDIFLLPYGGSKGMVVLAQSPVMGAAHL